MKEWEPYDLVRGHLVDALSARALTSCFASPAETIWEHLLTTAMGWLQIHLPAVLYGHVSGAAPSKCPAARRAGTGANKTGDAARSCAIQRQRTLSQPRSTSAPLKPPSLGVLPRFAVAPPSSVNFLRHCAHQLKDRMPASVKRSCVGCVHWLPAWTLPTKHVQSFMHFRWISSSTAPSARRIWRPTTPSDYLNAFADDFHVALDGVRLYGISEATYAGVFRKLLKSGAATGPARIAALKAVHQFLRAWWQVPPLPTDLLQIEVESTVRANLVWPHEKSGCVNG